MATTLVNLLDEPLEVMFDGVPYVFGVGQELTLPDGVAKHLRKRSLISDNPVTGQGVFALARKGIDPIEPAKRGPELLDRSDLEDERARNVEYVTFKNEVGAEGPVASALDGIGGGSEASAIHSRRVAQG